MRNVFFFLNNTVNYYFMHVIVHKNSTISDDAKAGKK